MSSDTSGAPGIRPEPGARGFLARAIDLRPGEGPVVAWAWLYIFAILSSYYVMRPIRDQMGIGGGIENLPWLFSGTLVGMIVLNVPFGWLVKRLPRIRFIPIVYRFFTANIVLFACALYLASGDTAVWIGRLLFIWLSVFNLFVVSVFWQTIVDVFSSEQGKRLFGFIAAGATVGAIAGSAATAVLARNVPTWALLLGAALLLELAVWSVRRLSGISDSLHRLHAEPAGERPVGGSILSGFTHALRSPYLLNVSLFLLLYSVTSTFLYFQQVGITAKAFPDRAAQTQFFATVDLLVNCLTLGVQLFLTGRIVRLIGVGLALATLPLLSVIGFGVIAVVPTIMTVIGFQVLRRAGNFAIARPTREMLFTVVPREDRYKAKGFIDTVVYRVGDQLGAWSNSLVGLAGLGGPTVPLVAAALSVIWVVNALWLGNRQQALAAAEDPDGEAADGPARPSFVPF